MGKLTPEQETFLAKYLSNKKNRTLSEIRSDRKKTAEYKTYLKDFAKIADVVGKLPKTNNDRPQLQQALIASEELAAQGEFAEADKTLRAVIKPAKAAIKKAANIAREAKKQQAAARAHAEELRSAPDEPTISSPKIESIPMEGTTGLVQDALVALSAEADRIAASFKEINATLKDKNPALAGAKTSDQQNFETQLKDIRGALMALRNRDAPRADAAQGGAKDAAIEAVQETMAEIVARKDALIAAATAAIAELKSNPDDAVTNALQTQAEEKAREDYAKMRDDLLELHDRLSDWDSEQAPALGTQIARLAVENPDDIGTAIGKLAELVEVAKLAEKAHQTAYIKEREPTEQKYLRQKSELDAVLKTPAGKALSTEQREALENDFDIIDAILSTGQNTESLHAAQAMMALAQTKLDSFKEADKTVADIKTALKAVQDALKDKTNKSLRPEQNAELQGELDALNDGWAAMTLPAALEAANALQARTITDSDSYNNKSEEQAKARAEQDAIMADIDNMLKEANDLITEVSNGKITKFQGEILTQVEQARTMMSAESEAGIAAAKATLTALKDKLEHWISSQGDPQTRSDIMVDHLKGANAAEIEKRNKAAFESEFKAVTDELRHSRKAHGIKDNFAEYDNIEAFLKSTKDAMSAPDGYEIAMQGLDRVRKRIKTVENRNRTLDVGELKKISQIWEDAVAMTETRMTINLMQSIEAAAGTEENGATKLGPETRTSLEKSFTDAVKVLDPRTFDYAANLFKMADAEDGKALQGREEALRRIRALRELMGNDPVLRALTANPFSVGGVLTPVNTALRDLEHKALVGV